MRVENPAWHIKTGGKWRRPLSGSNILARLELQSEVSVDRLVSNIRPPTLSFIQFVRSTDDKEPKKFNLDMDLKLLDNLQNTLTEIRKNNAAYFADDK